MAVGVEGHGDARMPQAPGPSGRCRRPGGLPGGRHLRGAGEEESAPQHAVDGPELGSRPVGVGVGEGLFVPLAGEALDLGGRCLRDGRQGLGAGGHVVDGGSAEGLPRCLGEVGEEAGGHDLLQVGIPQLAQLADGGTSDVKALEPGGEVVCRDGVQQAADLVEEAGVPPSRRCRSVRSSEGSSAVRYRASTFGSERGT